MQLAEFETPEQHLRRLRVLLVVLATAGSSTRARYVEQTSTRFGLGPSNQVVEIASNDGYLLQYFVDRGHPGARHRAGGQRRRGGAASGASRRWSSSSAPSSRRGCAPRARRADLLIGNNVLAHVPDLNDFVAGMATLLSRRRRHHHGVPAPPPADAAEPVRHHLPRALLVLLVPHGRRRVFAHHGLRSSTSRRSRPTAVRCASTPATRTNATHADDRPGAAAPRARARGRPRPARAATRVRRAGAADEADAAALPASTPRSAAPPSPRTARRPRATRC